MAQRGGTRAGWAESSPQWRRASPGSSRTFGSEALCYLDLDNFKKVNDRYGHAGGDAALTRVAQLLRETTRETDIAARLGGDEFALFLWDLTVDDATRIAGRLIDDVAQLGASFEGTGLGASAGVAFFDSPPENADDAIRHADDAMYRSKSAGKGRVFVIRP